MTDINFIKNILDTSNLDNYEVIISKLNKYNLDIDIIISLLEYYPFKQTNYYTHNHFILISLLNNKSIKEFKKSQVIFLINMLEDPTFFGARYLMYFFINNIIEISNIICSYIDGMKYIYEFKSIYNLIILITDLIYDDSIEFNETISILINLINKKVIIDQEKRRILINNFKFISMHYLVKPKKFLEFEFN